jgi:cyclic pyranopterin phosphate synthase
MVDTGAKSPTRRVCIASGRLLAAPATLLAIREGRLPKGNALPLAEAAAITAVKKTSEFLPLCHPLPIDAALVSFEFEPRAIRVFCEVRAHAKTGVEMEALSGVNAALLCLYDLTKGIDPALELADILLLEKTGGKSGAWRHPRAEGARGEPPPEPTSPSDTRNPPGAAIPPVTAHDSAWSGIRAAVLTLSDRCARDEQTDRSGPLLADRIEALGGRVDQTRILPDDSRKLATAIEEILASMGEGSLILTTGGTGLGPRDITPETVALLGGRLIPGFGERMRRLGERSTPLAALSRGEAHALRGSLLILLPGSEKGASESFDAISSLIPHSLKILRGGNHG